ncbi:hypothetical protein, partial [Photobacterium toruni]
MDRAYNETTDTIEYAAKINEKEESLRKKHLEKANYKCPNFLCRYDATPCAFGDKYVQPAHFRYLNGHVTNCTFNKASGVFIEEKDKNGNYSYRQAYITELIEPKLTQKKSSSNNTTLKDSMESSSSSANRKNVKNGTSKRKVQVSSCLSAPTNFYMQDSINNASLAFTVLGRKGTYQSQYQKISKSFTKYKNNYIFYSPIYSFDEIKLNKNEIIVTLLPKDSLTNKRYELHLLCQEWPEQHKKAVYDELKRALKTSKDNYKSNSFECVNLFFLGKQDKLNSNIFFCEYAEFLYVYIGSKFNLSYNKFGTYDFLEKEVDNKDKKICIKQPQPQP